MSGEEWAGKHKPYIRLSSLHDVPGGVSLAMAL